MTGIVGDDGARRQADQALAVPVEPVARLDPAGFERDRRAITRMLVKWRAFKRRCNPIASLTQGGKTDG